MRRFLAAEEAATPATSGDEPARPLPAVPDPVVSAGRFGLIGLEELREAVGPKWPSLQERVRALSEAVISRHLQRGDLFEAQEDGTYVVLFAHLNNAAAEFKCRVIGKEITQRLLGSDSVRLADVATVSTDVSRAALVANDLGALERAFSAAQPFISSDPASPRPPEAPARAGPADTSRPQSTGCYTPVWDIRSGSLVRFRLTAADWRAWRSESSADENGRTVAFEIDTGALARALADLSRITSEGRRLSVICVIHQSSLSVQWRLDELLELVGHAPAAVRHLLRVEIFSDRFVPHQGVARFVEALAGLGVQCAFCTRLDSPEAIRPAGMKLKTACTEVPPGLPQSDAFSLLNTFARRSAQVDLESAAHALDTRSLVMGAMAAGVRFMSGAAIHPPIRELGQGLRFQPSDLYRELRRRAVA